MTRLIDLTGKRFGKLVVTRRAANALGGAPQWLCECDCGDVCVVRGAHLRYGKTRSCGCLLDALRKKKRLKQATYTCQHCGKEFGGIKSRPRVYCGRDCQTASSRGRKHPGPRKPQQGKVTRTCQCCGKEFQLWKYREKTGRGKYCGVECYRKVGPSKVSKRGTKIERECEKCGKPFQTWTSHVKRGWGRFCGQSCSNSTKSQAPPWRGDLPWKKNSRGYLVIKRQSCPVSSPTGMLLQHRLAYWQAHGESNEVLALLKNGAVIHHLNGIKDDNRIENLEMRLKGHHPYGVGEADMVKTLAALGYRVERVGNADA